jgi:pyruvate/2-oxoglutarate dehydrogenase complex dihydrolipoamide acyltransferase (E2) component
MDQAAAMRYSRVGMTLVLTAALWGCGPGDDKGKEKKAEPAPPPKAAPAPPPAPAKKKEEAKPAPTKASAKLEAEGWTLLGQEQANRKGESDRITVDPTKKAVKELRIVVEGAPLDLEAMTVTFGNDRQIKANVPQNLSANSASAPIDLPGEKRGIKYVDLTYRTAVKGAGKATVMIYGR